ncbi:hypothetical protein [Paracoccus saliphilus]|uniref:hypothetical protein n=1 Tax=Paracoccus saliphilus TaxID=405559 RepID=UPI00158B58C6|nr:hypothetical protein [Paracoccus saliphilus]
MTKQDHDISDPLRHALASQLAVLAKPAYQSLRQSLGKSGEGKQQSNRTSRESGHERI